ncbi:MAG: hypothetical protein KA228_06240 [Flavobacterium sp.]|nr:hypothetical protein [Flavobacterium sp.]
MIFGNIKFTTSQSIQKHIKNLHLDFLKKLKEKKPTISPRELDLSTEIMNISSTGIELTRYR